MIFTDTAVYKHYTTVKIVIEEYLLIAGCALTFIIERNGNHEI